MSDELNNSIIALYIRRSPYLHEHWQNMASWPVYFYYNYIHVWVIHTCTRPTVFIMSELKNMRPRLLEIRRVHNMTLVERSIAGVAGRLHNAALCTFTILRMYYVDASSWRTAELKKSGMGIVAQFRSYSHCNYVQLKAANQVAWTQRRWCWSWNRVNSSIALQRQRS